LQLLEALQELPVGETLAQQVTLDQASTGLLADLLAARPNRIARDLAQHLVQRCVRDQASLQSLARLMTAVGFELFWSHLVPENLSERAVIVLGKLLLACKAPANDWIPVLGRRLADTRGEAFPLPVLRNLCKVITRRGRCREYLVPLVRSKETKEEVRLTALRFVEQDPDALAEACQWRFGELFASREVRERLKRARKAMVKEKP